MVIIKRDNNNKMGKKKTDKSLSNNKIERLAITFYIRVEIWLMPIRTENTHKVHIMVREHWKNLTNIIRNNNNTNSTNIYKKTHTKKPLTLKINKNKTLTNLTRCNHRK